MKKKNIKKRSFKTRKNITTIQDMLSSVHTRDLAVIVVGVLFLLGGMLGYSLGVIQQASYTQYHELSVVSERSKRVLGAKERNEYINPFELVNVKRVVFPVAQLKGCRNFSECYSLCSDFKHFSACSAWSRSQK